MTIVLHDLALKDDIRPSPFCWRTRLALEHKGLAYTTVPTPFTGIPMIAGGGHKTVPVIEDQGSQGQRIVADSWAIAEYLEATYPDRPSLFGGEAGHAYALFLRNWIAPAVMQPAVKAILLDVYNNVVPEDRTYFRASREQRLGKKLEDVAGPSRADDIAAVRAALEQVRTVVKKQAFLSGTAPLYPDYLVAGFFFWWRALSPTRLLEADDPLTHWFARVLNLYPRIAKESTRVWDGP